MVFADENIRVICRLQPEFPSIGSQSIDTIGKNKGKEVGGAFLTPDGEDEGENSITSFTPDGEVTYLCDSVKRHFKLHACAGPLLSQSNFYNKYIGDIVTSVSKGYNGTILTYGCTGSGKTFTIKGVTNAETGAGSKLKEKNGIIPRALQHLIVTAASMPDTEITFSLSYLQIYCEILQDLLSDGYEEVNLGSSLSTNQNLSIREKGSNVYVEHLTSIQVSSVEECMKLLEEGDRRRANSNRFLNEQSSRSHGVVIFSMTQRSREKDDESGSSKIVTSNLMMVDLAGSERVKKTDAKFQQFEELKAINLSLSALGNCVAALSSTERDHVPYRDSKLTRLLQPSFGGSSRTVLIVCLQQNHDDGKDTLRSLQFAERASVVKTKPKRNEVTDYESLYNKLQSSIDERETALHNTELELGSLKMKLANSEEKVRELENVNATKENMESILSQCQSNLVSAQSEVQSNVLDVLENSKKEWKEKMKELCMEKSEQMEELKINYDQKILAYKTAASEALRDNDILENEIEKTKEDMLSTLQNVRDLTERKKIAKLDTSNRIGDLLAEINNKRDTIEELKTQIKIQGQEHDVKLENMMQRIKELEPHHAKNPVSDNILEEMESFFTKTVEKLSKRVNKLEEPTIGGHAKEQEGRKKMNPKSKKLLERMERKIVSSAGNLDKKPRKYPRNAFR